jgi:short-subunit dehydrogenase
MAKKASISMSQTAAWAAAGVGVLLAGSAIYREITKYSIRNKVVVVTGGSRGLGLVLARKLASKGARLALCARSGDHLSAAMSELKAKGAEVIAISADLQMREQAEDMITKVIAHYGRVDVLINNAGIVQVGPMEAMTIDDFETAMKSNFWAPLYTILAALPHFRRQGEGRILNITSIGGKIAVPHLLPYSASKFALTGLSEGLHAELKKYNIHVTTIVPHLMRTGSPRNITVKGNHEAEYAWFKLSDSSPLLSQDVNTAASKIIHALEYGVSEEILALTAKIATIAKGFAPGWVSALMTLADKFLPANIGEAGSAPRKGYESESARSRGRVAAITDRAAVENNEM